MMLEGKVAAIYGAGGSIGGAIARAFAREGARVFLTGRTRTTLDALAGSIRSDGGQVDSAIVDALDPGAVDTFVDDVVSAAGSLDISVNVIGVGDVQRPLMDLSVSDFMQPIDIATRTQFVTTKAAARHMIAQRGGVVLAFGGGGTQTIAGLGRTRCVRHPRCHGEDRRHPRNAAGGDGRTRRDHPQHRSGHPAPPGRHAHRRRQRGRLRRVRRGSDDDRDRHQHLVRLARGLILDPPTA